MRKCDLKTRNNGRGKAHRSEHAGKHSAKEPYNPLAKMNLGESVADALLRSPVRPLNETAHLVGAGVYAIYYIGAFFAYKRIKELNEGDRFEQPIYVGKAVPKGARKGGLSFDAERSGPDC